MANGKRYRRFDPSILDKIDNQRLVSDYRPYDATKKQHVTNSELFSDSMYKSPDEDGDGTDSEDSEGKGVAIGIIIAALVAVCAVTVLCIVLAM